jgi:hypothetical protein
MHCFGYDADKTPQYGSDINGRLPPVSYEDYQSYMEPAAGLTSESSP